MAPYWTQAYPRTVVEVAYLIQTNLAHLTVFGFIVDANKPIIRYYSKAFDSLYPQL